MATKGMSNEQLYYDALRRITKYSSPGVVRKTAEKQYGLSPEEALEYAYENMQQEAVSVLRGKRRPKEGK